LVFGSYSLHHYVVGVFQVDEGYLQLPSYDGGASLIYSTNENVNKIK